MFSNNSKLLKLALKIKPVCRFESGAKAAKVDHNIASKNPLMFIKPADLVKGCYLENAVPLMPADLYLIGVTEGVHRDRNRNGVFAPNFVDALESIDDEYLSEITAIEITSYDEDNPYYYSGVYCSNLKLYAGKLPEEVAEQEVIFHDQIFMPQIFKIK